MADFAQFVALEDQAFDLPDERGNTERTPHFSLANLDAGRTVIVFFRVNSRHGQVHLRMRVNGHSEHFIDRTFESSESDTAITRSWHEILPGSQVNAGDNELIISMSSDSGGKVTVSDLVFLYHART